MRITVFRAVHIVNNALGADEAMQLEVQRRLRGLAALAVAWTRNVGVSALSIDVDVDAEPHSSPSRTAGSPSRPSRSCNSSPLPRATTPDEPEYNSDDDSLLLISDDDGDDPVADLVDADPRAYGVDEDDGRDDGVDNTESTYTPPHASADRVDVDAVVVTPSPAEHAAAAPRSGLAPEARAHGHDARPAARDAVIEIEDSSASEAENDDSDEEGAAAVRDEERPRRCGEIHCEGDDVARMASRTRWLSGDGLAVFAQSYLDEVQNARVGHLDATVCRDIKCYLEGLEEADVQKQAANKDWVARKLLKVWGSQYSANID